MNVRMLPREMMISFRTIFLGLCLVCLLSSRVAHSFGLWWGTARSRTTQGQARLATALRSSTENQALEAIQSLADFHEGQWQGIAKSFTVSADTAAGILQRTSSPRYTASVKLGMDLVNRDYTLTETLEWDNNKVSSRTISLEKSNADVDTVDASFSLDMTLPNLPSALIGTDKLPQFLIEHCIAINDNERAKCWVLYGVDQALMRVVICHETRVKDDTKKLETNHKESVGGTLTAADLVEMQSDVDRLVDKITGTYDKNADPVRTKALEEFRATSGNTSSISSTKIINNSPSPGLQKQSANLLELTSGTWLGDMILRDKPFVPLTPEIRGQGFGSSSSSSRPRVSKSGDSGFAQWSIGVQKAAWRWMWNFGEEIRHVTDYGRGIGTEFVGSTDSMPGDVCVNEGMSRRMAKEDRMVYIDWSSSSSVSFLCDSCSVQAPRYLSFGPSSDARRTASRPFLTEFGVFQQSTTGNQWKPPLLNTPMLETVEGLSDDDFTMDVLPEVVCSKISRVYNFEGLLKQGCTSFFTLKRFGSGGDTQE